MSQSISKRGSEAGPAFSVPDVRPPEYNVDAFHDQTNFTIRRIPLSDASIVKRIAQSDAFHNRSLYFVHLFPFQRGGIIASVQPVGKTSLGYR